MTFDELILLIRNTEWFQQLGQPGVDDEYVRLPNLQPWSDGGSANPMAEQLADKMAWLPSARDQDDPIHRHSLEKRAEVLGKKQECTNRSLEAYKATLMTLRTFDGHPVLKVGPRNFAEAARGAALYATRRAAYEALIEEPSFWCRLMNVYHSGHWPCGILPDRRIVVL